MHIIHTWFIHDILLACTYYTDYWLSEFPMNSEPSSILVIFVPSNSCIKEKGRGSHHGVLYSGILLPSQYNGDGYTY